MVDVVQGIDPRTGQPVGEPVEYTERERLDEIAAQALVAFDDWAATPAAERAAALALVADRLDEASGKLVEIADAETALGEARLTGEVTRTTNQLRLFAQVLRDGGYLDAIISPADPLRTQPDVRRMLVPRGPVAVFAASNFPFAFSVAGGDTASALAAGCPVIVKAHEAHPATSAAVAGVVGAALAEAGAPPGTFGVVYGPPIGSALVQHPAIAAVGFTGSLRGGRALFDLAVRRPDPIPFYGELGSINPVVVLPEAAARDAEAIAAGYAGSLTLGTGQFCTNPGLLFVPEDPALLAALAAAIGATEGGPMLTARMAEAYRGHAAWDRLEVLAKGTGGEVVPEVRQLTLVTFAANIDLLTEERFGPAGLVVRYSSLDGLLEVLRRLPGSLTASVHARESEYAAAGQVGAVLARRAGRLIMNGWPTGVAVCWAMHHGGPWPATTDAHYTSVGATAIGRWLVPLAYQNWPDELLPVALQDVNPLSIPRHTEG